MDCKALKKLGTSYLIWTSSTNPFNSNQRKRSGYWQVTFYQKKHQGCSLHLCRLGLHKIKLWRQTFCCFTNDSYKYRKRRSWCSPWVSHLQEESVQLILLEDKVNLCDEVKQRSRKEDANGTDRTALTVLQNATSSIRNEHPVNPSMLKKPSKMQRS